MGFMGLTGKRTMTGHGRRRRGGRGDTAQPAARVGGRAGVLPAAGHRPERLEDRVLFSTAVATAVSLVWKGQTVKAYQNQWVVETGSAADLTKLAAQQGFTGLTGLGGNGFYEFTSTDSAAAVRRLATAHPVALGKVQPNMVIGAASITEPDDPQFGAQWGLSNTGQLESYDYTNTNVVTPYDMQTFPNGIPGGAQTVFPSPPYTNDNHYGVTGDDIDATQAWGITTGSKSVVVAVLDTGIDLTNPDLVNNIWTNPLDTAANGENGDGYPGDIHGYNFIANDGDPSDDEGHGTNVAGIIGASGDNAYGVSGVDWNVSLVAVKVLDENGSGSDASIIGGINYVTNLKDHGINVVAINESLGGNIFPTDILESDATRQAGRAGILDVVAAGNNSSDNDRTTFDPAQFSATYPTVITVAAVDNQFKIADFSDFGASTVDLGSPGVNILSTAPSYDVTSTDELFNVDEPAYYNPPVIGLNFGYDSGTSQATPFVTGTIALEAAANPSASPAQLKAALLKGVTYDPNLAPSNGTPAKVLTSGVVNAYRAVLDVLDPFDGTNTTRGGDWHSFYGYQGAYVVGDSTTASTSFADVTQTGGSPVVVQNDTTNPAALERVSDPSSRVDAYEGSATTESINVDFTDGLSHQTEIYLLDADHKKRTEMVAIIDPSSGSTLDAETVSNFTKGEYLSWTLRGDVEIVLTSVSGGAAYSGLFFDYPASAPATYVDTDTTTAGSLWRNSYGTQGDFIAGDNNTGTVPTDIGTVNIVGGNLDVLKAATRDPHGLQDNFDYTHNVDAYYANADHEDVDVTFTDSLAHTVTLYLADYNRKHRSERVEVINTANGGILATQDVNNFQNGEFVSFDVTGDTTFRILRTAGPDAVVSGVFLDAPFGEAAHFAGTDTTTQGNYRTATYGTTAAYVVGDDFPGLDVPANSQVNITGASRGVIATPTANPTALFKTEVANAATRVEAYAYTASSMTISYNPGDFVQHQLELYFADYENDHRTESITISNGGATPLVHQVLTNFHKGKYLIYDVSGPVLITIDTGTPANAVLSGLFID